MKARCLLLFLLLSVFFFTTQSRAAETEPNNTPATANVLPLNGSNSGTITPSDVDWYTVTLTGDGAITYTITETTGQYASARLYDADGVTELGYTEAANGSASKTVDGLAAGTYYIKINAYYDGQTPAYSISNTLAVPTQANDAEPNGTVATALTLALNGNHTGHVGYYYNHQRDTVDWYKVTTNANGRVRLYLTGGNGNYVSCQLYDGDGTTALGGRIDAINNTTPTTDIDGLAAGTYYIAVFSYYQDQFEPYVLADSLFTPAQANDAEPNGTVAQSLTLPLNGNHTGQVGYYYNHQRDTVDWYKLTTTSDGRIRLYLTGENGNYVSCQLYDGDGTTALGGRIDAVNGVTSTTDIDGLATGTYYVAVHSYYQDQFEPYVLADSLFTTIPNDAEPNNTVATAQALPIDTTTNGHVGYYYNHRRDTVDWYKIVTPKNGAVKLIFTGLNGNYASAQLYNYDGTTPLGGRIDAINGNASSSIIDGLGAGTYYIAVFSYYQDQFEPYTLTDSLLTYNPNDTVPNDYFNQAPTLLANRTTTGDVGFLFKDTRDYTDIWKINYTGTDGNLNLTFTGYPHIGDGANVYLQFQVYKDTAAAPIYNNTFIGGPNQVNLTGLTQGYYYIKVYAYYNDQFSAYSITDNFTQVNIATIAVKSTRPNVTVCNGNSLTYSLGASHSPYGVQLYRDGVKYDSVNVVSDTARFDNLLSGVYYATIYGDGATDAAHGTSATTTFLPPTPTGLSTSDIRVHTAQLNWTPFSCVTGYSVQYRLSSATTWTTLPDNNDSTGKYTLTGLMMYTDYTWRVASVDTAEGTVLLGAYSDTLKFRTLSDTAIITRTRVTQGSTCNSSSIKYTSTHSVNPYTVQLYRNGVAYGSPVSSTDTTLFTGLPAGIYYATSSGTGSGGSYGTSGKDTILPPPPTGLTTTNIGVHSAKVNWTPLSCESNYRVQYRLSTATTWTTLDDAHDAVGTYTLTGLASYTSYTWRVASVDTAQGFVLVSAYSDTLQFITLSDTAHIVRSSKTQGATCSSSTLVYALSNSVAPYTVQLYRYGAAYGTAVQATGTATFSSLPTGIYYATATGTGSGGSLGTSGTDSILPPVPTSLDTMMVTAASAEVTWSPLSCVSYFTIEYRTLGSSTWTMVQAAGTQSMDTLLPLLPDTLYEWRIASVDNTAGAMLMSSYSGSDTFRTMGALPVTLISFTAKPVNNTVQVSWQTANEINASYYVVQRSTDGVTFSTVGTVQAGAQHQYAFTDNSPARGKSYYRLRQVDRDGRYTDSKIVPVNFSGSLLLTLYPNPAVNVLHINLFAQGKATLAVYDNNGKMLMQKVVSDGTSSEQFGVSGLAAGTYTVVLQQADGSHQSARFIKQ